MDSEKKYHQGLDPNNDNENMASYSDTIQKINKILTPIQAAHIVNRLLLHCDDDELTKDAEILKKWIKSK